MKTLIYTFTGLLMSLLITSCGYVNKDIPNEQLEALKQEVFELDKRCETLKTEKLGLETAISKKDLVIKDYRNQIEEVNRNCK
jgi:hypothetical protein